MLVAAITPALAGCLGSAQGTAQASLSPAEQAARRWDGGAYLVGVIGYEGAPGPWMSGFLGDGWGWTSESTSAHGPRTSQDARVGDGVCEVWVYGYRAPGKAAMYVVAVDKDGRVLRAGESEPDMVAVGAWRVNSDEALRIAKNANDGLRRGVESQHFALVLALGKEAADPRARWMIAGGGGDASGGGGDQVVLDAVSGEVLVSRGMSGTM